MHTLRLAIRIICIIFCCFGYLSMSGQIQTVVCVDYDIPCTNPNVLNENFGIQNETGNIIEPLPYELESGLNELHFDIPCGIIQNMTIQLAVEHSNPEGLEIGLSIENLNPFLNELPPLLVLDLIEPSSCNTGTALDLDVVFDESALQSFNDACQNNTGTLTGTYNPFGTLTALNGRSAGEFKDNWILKITNPDNTTGRILSAQINFEMGFPAPYEILEPTLVEAVELTSEQVVETGCNQDELPYGAKIERIFEIQRTNGNIETCTQVVGLITPALNDLKLPPNDTITCDNINNFDENYLLPYSYGCYPLTEDLHGLCDLSYTYEDLILPTVLGKKIFRSWTVFSWCTGQHLDPYQQTIVIECKVGDLTGNVQTLEGDTIPVIVTLGGDTVENQLSEDGSFLFENVVLEQDYTLSVTKNDDYLNGVSTYDLVLMSRHILASEIIEDPYKMIAADVNEDGNITTLDIIILRQLILASIAELPSGKSWRFFDVNQTFDNPFNPFDTPFLEEIQIENFSSEQEPINFIGVKVGDVG